VSKLLIDEPPLQVLPRLATVIGLHEAIILQQIHYWLEINKKVGRNFKNGYHWTFNSYMSWQEQFPFISLMSIRRAIGNLRKQKLLITANLSPHKFDNTLWYRINYPAVNSLELVSVGQENPASPNEKDGLNDKKNKSSVQNEHTIDDPIPKDERYDKMRMQYLIHQEGKKKSRKGKAVH
jgi:hypothetical protein